MRLTVFLTSLLSSLTLVHAVNTTVACSLLNGLLPGKVAYPSSDQYVSDTKHWATGSSSQASACTVEPSTPQDVALIFGVIQKTRTTWAVKGGGNTFNPGFSSTDGVLISTVRFKDIQYSPMSSTVKVGAGNLWDDVYAKLIPLGATVVGNRVPGIGVGGFSLWGGISWKTQKYGLGLDNVVSFQLVTPTSQILNVSAHSYPDLYFGLRGGGNNFGIVTSFVFKTHPQGQVYAGVVTYSGLSIQQEYVDFDTSNKDPNAYILPIYVYHGGVLSTNALVFYDGPVAPNGTYDAFFNAANLTSNDVKTRSFLEFQQTIHIPAPTRTATHVVSIANYTKPIVDAIVTQHLNLSNVFADAEFIMFTMEPLYSSIFDSSNGGAYPHTSAHPWKPFNLFLGYTNPASDAAAMAAVMSAATAVQQIAIAEGKSSLDAVLDINYAGLGTDLKYLYGKNLPLLRTLRAKYDPHNLLSLTGGWKL
ncbi:hypothetical protein M422DRAFT_783691 [Sphaerobolus stellatus SS14]|uniref:Unplaced genomic scaffold SPHSTscaffold_161, whole genome shotgun sequence n=1 Tax=Sphaerobolus stellatus (strain SS14) TaxID=990650 RepID=A0A0C9UB97_SPHS4|nr:hypothetical protein M422DRAFT_783691 [Sphaerobolus stellatus SS14]